MLMTQGVRISFVRCVVPHSFEILSVESVCFFTVFSASFLSTWSNAFFKSNFAAMRGMLHSLSLSLSQFHFLLPQARERNSSAGEWRIVECRKVLAR